MAGSRPSPSPSELRHKIPTYYMWLYRNDRAWLDERMLELPRGRRAEKRRVDWIARDIALARAIRSAAQAIRASEDVPIRISLSELGRRTGRSSWLEKQRAKLPICSILLQDVLETVAEFQARRLQWWERHLRDKEGLSPAPSKLHRVAGIPTRRRASEADSFSRH
ncbi:TnsD family Tn7-like transposition protein [Pararobbsia silviterrae]|uniref:TnsD family Tn7-like transposition protein n=1 Tax=Pararobbsia silviterrae TaxID=1792498 RepID=UPI003B8304A3